MISNGLYNASCFIEILMASINAQPVAYQCLKEFFRKTLNKTEGGPEVVTLIQTCGGFGH